MASLHGSWAWGPEPTSASDRHQDSSPNQARYQVFEAIRTKDLIDYTITRWAFCPCIQLVDYQVRAASRKGLPDVDSCALTPTSGHTTHLHARWIQRSDFFRTRKWFLRSRFYPILFAVLIRNHPLNLSSEFLTARRGMHSIEQTYIFSDEKYKKLQLTYYTDPKKSGSMNLSWVVTSIIVRHAPSGKFCLLAIIATGKSVITN